jgi:hypothetical protein
MATIIRITSKRAGFRRCGIAHPVTPTDYPVDRFTAEQIKGLKTEPMLKVEILEIETEEEKAEAEKAAAEKAAAEKAEAEKAEAEQPEPTEQPAPVGAQHAAPDSDQAPVHVKPAAKKGKK